MTTTAPTPLVQNESAKRSLTTATAAAPAPAAASTTDELKALKQLASYIPYSDQLASTSLYVYKTYTPATIQQTVEQQVLPVANPYLNSACAVVLDDIIPPLQRAAAYPQGVYTYVLGKTHSTIDYVLPPLSSAKPMSEETATAAQTLFAIPQKISQRLKERSSQLVETDIKELVSKYVADFVDKVESSEDEGKEVSVYRLLNDVLVILQTTPLPAALPKTIPIPGKAPSPNMSTYGACNKLYIDSREFSVYIAHQLMQRYQARQTQLIAVVSNVVDKMRTVSHLK